MNKCRKCGRDIKDSSGIWPQEMLNSSWDEHMDRTVYSKIWCSNRLCKLTTNATYFTLCCLLWKLDLKVKE